MWLCGALLYGCCAFPVLVTLVHSEHPFGLCCLPWDTGVMNETSPDHAAEYGRGRFLAEGQPDPVVEQDRPVGSSEAVTAMHDHEAQEALSHLGEVAAELRPEDLRPLSFNRADSRWLAGESLGSPVVKTRTASSLEDMEKAVESVGLPARLVPAVGPYSYIEVQSIAEAQSYWNGQDTLVEQVIDGAELVTIQVIRSVDPTTGEEASWFSEPIGHDVSQSVQPMPISETARDAAHSIAVRIVQSMNEGRSTSGRGLYSVTLWVAGDRCYFEDVVYGPRRIGLITLYTQRYSQYELHARAKLGLPVDVTLTSPGAAMITDRPVDVKKALALDEVDVRACEIGNIIVATAPSVEEAAGRIAEVENLAMVD